MKYVCALGAAAVLLSVASAQKAAGQDCGQNSDCAKGESGKPMWCGSQVDDRSSGCNFVKGMGADKDVCQDCPCETSKSKTKTCPAGNAAPAPPGGSTAKKCGGNDLTADSDPTSLNSMGLSCGTMCAGHALNATWKPILMMMLPMACTDQKKVGTKEKCLHDTEKPKDPKTGKYPLREPPICQVSHARAPNLRRPPLLPLAVEQALSACLARARSGLAPHARPTWSKSID